ncbi:MAG: TonB-dependent receptor [Bacteroides sp.]|nr:TonB-dependent receptor [Bacteroides sp.]
MKKLYIFIFSAMLSMVAAAISASATSMPSTSETSFLDSIVGLNEVSVSLIKSTSPVMFPASVTNINAEMIERYDIDGVKGVSEIAPNFYMPQYGSRMTSSIYVRGLGTRIDQPIVALNIDNVPLLNKDNYDFSFADLDRIEVVRGPQSILYGRNSIGGVINMSTYSPLKYQGVRALAEYGSGNTWRTSLSIYKKLSSTLGLAIGGGYNGTDGFFRNLYTGKKIDTERNWMARTKLAWQPSSRFLLENSAWVSSTRQGGYPYESLATGEINHNDTCFYRRTSVIDGLTMRWFSDKVTVSSITAFQYINDNMTLDQDFLPQDYFTLTQKRHEWSMTQDFVVKGSAGAYRYLGGLFGFYKRGNMSAPVTFKDYGIKKLIEDNANRPGSPMQIRWDERSMYLASDFLLPNWGFAVYHKSQYDWGNWSASVGLRLAYERNEIDYHSYVNTGITLYRQQGDALIPIRQIPVSLDLADRLHQTSLQLLPEIKLSYNFNSHTALGIVVSKGYKAGGYNTQMFSDILQQSLMGMMGGTPEYDVDEIISYDPEKSWNYELNATTSLFDNTLDLDATLFFIDSRDQQMTMFPDGTTTGRVMANAGRTHSKGIELTALWRAGDHFTVNASYGYADARFRKFNNGLVDCKDNHVPYAPVNTLFASVTYRTPVNTSWLQGIDINANCRGIGQIYWDEENTVRQPFYALAGLSVNMHTPIADFELWGENLTKTKYSTFYFESIGNRFVQRGNPRRFGVTVRFDLSL